MPIGDDGPVIDLGIWIARALFVGRHDQPDSTAEPICTRRSPMSGVVGGRNR